MNINQGQSLELFFIDGRPDGMLTAEVFNWTGHVLMTPRTQLSTALKRPEASNTGVYLLLGEDDNGPLAYIGEGEDISARIRSHDSQKDWWSNAILITTANNSLNKAHVKYLESRLVEEAKRIGKATLENGNTPPRPSLSEAAQANMEAFLNYVLIVLPAIRVDVLLGQTRKSEVAPITEQKYNVPDDGVVFEINNPRQGLDAKAVYVNGELIVREGSKGRAQWSSGSESHNYAKHFAELVRTGVLDVRDDCAVFTVDYAFKSPSPAAAMINGRPSNGTTDWKLLGTEKTYKQWEQERLES